MKNPTYFPKSLKNKKIINKNKFYWKIIRHHYTKEYFSILQEYIKTNEFKYFKEALKLDSYSLWNEKDLYQHYIIKKTKNNKSIYSFKHTKYKDIKFLPSYVVIWETITYLQNLSFPKLILKQFNIENPANTMLLEISPYLLDNNYTSQAFTYSKQYKDGLIHLKKQGNIKKSLTTTDKFWKSFQKLKKTVNKGMRKKRYSPYDNQKIIDILNSVKKLNITFNENEILRISTIDLDHTVSSIIGILHKRNCEECILKEAELTNLIYKIYKKNINNKY